mgnify:FL=1
MTNGKTLKKKYTEEQIANAVTNCVNTWDIDTLVMYTTEMLYKKYMDRSLPIADLIVAVNAPKHIDDLMKEFGNANDN